MELLNLQQIAELAGIPISLARYYRDRFILFVPSVRLGRSILHPIEAVDVVRTINDLAGNGLPAHAIESALEEAFPVTVVNAQMVDSPGSGVGPPAAVRAFADAIDARGARLESELSCLRADVTALRENATGRLPAPDCPTFVRDDVDAGDLDRVSAMIGDVYAQLSQLASREQLEWIGDVVAAAALRPPHGMQESAVERRVRDLSIELLSAIGSSESELRERLDQITERVNQRDQEFQRAFQALAALFRREIGELRTTLVGLSEAAEAATRFMREDLWVPERSGANDDANDQERTRLPRRLGQPLKPNGLPIVADELAHGAD
jgi:hypothetical protein